MDLRIKITTPPGMAQGFSKNLTLKVIKKILIGKGHIKEEYIDTTNTEIFWLVDVHARHYNNTLRKISAYRQSAEVVFENKMARKMINKMADKPEDVVALRKMIVDGTTVEYVTGATANEILEGSKSFWQKMKEKFFKSKPITEDEEKE